MVTDIVEGAYEMRIALIAPEFLPNWGGVGTYCIELARFLTARSDIELHVVAPLRRFGPVEYSESKISAYFQNRIHLHLLGTAGETFLYNSGFQLRVWRHLPRIIREHHIDIVHSQHAHMPDILFKLRSASHHVPTVATVHSTVKNQYDGIKATGQSWAEMESSEKYELLLYPMLRTAEAFYLRRSDALICVSRWTLDHLPGKGAIDRSITQVINNGVDTKRFRPREPSDRELPLSKVSDPIVLYTSRFTAARGAHLLARAAPMILKSTKEVHFAFVGGGDHELLRSILRRLNVPPDKYTIVGYVEHDEMPSLYRCAYAYAMPTSWENMPFKLLEAMGSGLPVVTTNVGGIPEVVRDGYNGLLISREEKSVSEAILRLLEDRGLAKRLGENARSTVVDNFSWGTTTEKTMRVYEQLLASRMKS